MKALILAGGFATRLWPLTEKRAKPLLLIQNIPLISHIVEGIPEDTEVIVSTNLLFKKDFEDWKQKEFPERKIEIFIEDSESDKEKLGALGAVSLLIQQKGIDDDIMLLAGDNYFGFSMQTFQDAFEGKPQLAVYDIKDLKRASQFGVVISKDGRTVDAFQEKPIDPLSTLVSTGAYIFPKKNLPDIITYAKIHKDDLGGIFEYLKNKNTTIHVYSFEEPWFDVGSFQGYLEAHIALSHAKQSIDTTAQIKSSELKGAIAIAQNCKVENAILENVILFPNVTIKNAEVRNSIIDENCVIKEVDISYKILREGSQLS